MDKDGVFLTTAVLPLAIKYTVVAKWRSPADGVAGLGGLTVQAHCLSGYSHYPPPQPPAQLSQFFLSVLFLCLFFVCFLFCFFVCSFVLFYERRRKEKIKRSGEGGGRSRVDA